MYLAIICLGDLNLNLFLACAAESGSLLFSMASTSFPKVPCQGHPFGRDSPKESLGPLENPSDNFLCGDLRQVSSFGEVLPDQSIEVFVGSSLPGMIGLGKVKIDIECFCYL